MQTAKYEVTHEWLKKYEQAAADTYAENAYRFETDYIMQKCKEASLEDSHVAEIKNFCDYLETDEELKKYLWLFYYMQFESGERIIELWGYGLCTVHMPEEIEKKYPGMCCAVVYIIAIDHLRKAFEGFGYDYERIEAGMQNYYSSYKRFASLNMMSYNTHGFIRLWPFVYAYAKPIIIRLGRLAFEVANFKNTITVYKNAEGKEIIAALPLFKYDKTGHYNQEEGDYYPVYLNENGILKYNTFDDAGILDRTVRELDLNEYTLELQPGDKVLTAHIPGNEKMTADKIDESLAMAKKAINEEFKEYGVKRIVCSSWIMDSQLREVFTGKHSNILDFQNRFMLTMTDDDTWHTLREHIFRVKQDIATEDLVPENDFQRKMLDRVKAGKKLYIGFGILKPEN